MEIVKLTNTSFHINKQLREGDFKIQSTQIPPSRCLIFNKTPLFINGFTLIEMAIVLVIVGLLLGIGASLIGPLTKRAKRIETKQIINEDKESIIGYAIRNRKLSSDILSAGGKKKDSFGKDLLYITSTSPDLTAQDICSVISTNLQVQKCPDAICSTPQTYNNIAFIIVSGSENYNIQTANQSGIVRIYEPGTAGIDNYMADMNRPEEYDDQYVFVSLDELRQQMGCAQQLKISSPSILSEGEEDSFYSYQLTAYGGKPPYSWSTAGPISGLSIDSSGLISGIININSSSNTGELTACSDTITFTGVTVTDASGATDTQNISIPVRPSPIKIITETIPSAYEGSSYSATISATGGNSSAYSWTADCTGLSSTGLICSGNKITGTPSTGSAGTYTVTFTINDTCTSDTRTYGLTINP